MVGVDACICELRVDARVEREEIQESPWGSHVDMHMALICTCAKSLSSRGIPLFTRIPIPHLEHLECSH